MCSSCCRYQTVTILVLSLILFECSHKRVQVSSGRKYSTTRLSRQNIIIIIISSVHVLMLYDPHKHVVLQVDANDESWGGALLQPNDDGKLKPVAFNLCTVNPTERHYSHIEKERLAICSCFQQIDHWQNLCTRANRSPAPRDDSKKGFE